MGLVRQRGIIPVGLILWALAGLAVVTMVGGVVYSYNHAIARAEKAEAALADCITKYEQALQTIQKQNQATLALKAAAENALGRARQARQAAAKAQVSTQAERARLAALQQGSGGISCQQAVAEARKGLRP